ncbi:branched chain amino acid ABC transporter domain protein [Brucella abortus]|nr:branched chain amino acid ABC transporter domain protein [Brucella abortus]
MMPTRSAAVTAALVEALALANHVVMTRPTRMPASAPAAMPRSTASTSGTPAPNSATMTNVPMAPMAAPVKLTTATSL